VGHTQDDHIETVLMHLIRGSGTGGLRGLQPVNRWREALTVVRPLLAVTREETQAYCRKHELAPGWTLPTFPCRPCATGSVTNFCLCWRNTIPVSGKPY
jgi:tRNA(Ile)-lysidine synthase